MGSIILKAQEANLVVKAESITDVEEQLEAFATLIREDDAKRITELEAHVERLLDALENAVGWNWLDDDLPDEVNNHCQSAIEEAPSQSLEALRNEHLEEAAKVCENVKVEHMVGNYSRQYFNNGCGWSAEAIREMKE